MTVHQLNLIHDRTADLAAFDEFWEWFPVKKKKPASRALFLKITEQGGYTTRTLDKDSGNYIEIHLQASAAEIVTATKAFRKSLIPSGSGQYTPDVTYCPHPLTWLNQGRFED